MPYWLTSRRAFVATVRSWWASPAAEEVRAAYHDTKRAPGWVVLGMIGVFWPLTGFSLVPVGVAVVVWLIMMWTTSGIRYWFLRRRVRRVLRPLIGLLALLVLSVQAGIWAWLLSIGVWLIVAGLTDTWRAHHRLATWIVGAVSRTTKNDPDEFDLHTTEWDGRHLLYAEVDFGPLVRTEDAAARDRIAQAVAWSLRHAGRYTVSWPAGRASFEITATPTLPTSIYEQDWGDLPGIPIGATDAEHADGVVDTVEAETGTVLESLPIVLVDPTNSDKHILVVGGTGAGKSVWMRGFIARGMRKGWWPGGVFILDGKGGSDFIVFEGREGVHCVARHPDEWTEWLPRISTMMRQRYDEDADYERGNTPKPNFPRYLVVLDEVQEIRATLGKNELDPILQQISRQIRASKGKLLVATQRPDAEDAIPGAVRDMLEDRIILGYMSDTGARMVLGKDWREAVDEYGSNTVPGRGLARVGGHLRRIQGFYLDTPREHPEVEHLYPPKTATVGVTQRNQANAESATTTQWAPRPAADASSNPQKAAQVAVGAAETSAGGKEAPTAVDAPPRAAPAPQENRDDQELPRPPRRRRRTI
ncbi:type IV secretory system conjugative DNA transfer family protein [Kibdelosporangium persicum]|uniref:FtsK domain-containing protein n=1 Tax=Kibdelosporangium persicum TaxID=2698649 RepID=A0ABX2FHF1_9PSEU|nr:hypothetical protein [Kibdelosporangium persicum]NRN70827.1 FtsK domain-containing protein [Kibdelosporangium persicum]